MSKERGAGLIFLFIGLLGFICAVRLPIGSLWDAGPGMLPLGVSLLLLLSGVFWLIHGSTRSDRHTTIHWRDAHTNSITPLKILGATTAFALLLDKLGYLMTTSLYLFALFYWISAFRMSTAIGIALAAGAGSWYLFDQILAVPLPEGALF
jgi:putative tricarboxylic transport membrane protein